MKRLAIGATTVAALVACGGLVPDLQPSPPPREIDFGRSVFVSKSLGVDGASCGTRDAPCATIGAGIAAGDAAHPIVVIGAGEYPESVALRARAVLSGGWDARRDGASISWTGAASAQQAVTIVPPPGKPGLVAQDIDGEAKAEYLTVSATSDGGAGSSTYGAFVVGVKATTVVSLSVVDVLAGEGSAGSAGASGANGDDAVGSCAAGSGSAGAPGSVGVPTRGKFAAIGWIPARSGDGGTGGRGENGTDSTAAPESGYGVDACLLMGNPKTCVPGSPNQAQTAGLPGQSGCGGRGGAGGAGGMGGGASVALYVVGALATVKGSGGTYATQAGGAGGPGGAGGAGGKGATGVAGADSSPVIMGCSNNKCVQGVFKGGGAGGTGGLGGVGGAGGGGEGGPSCVWVVVDGATVSAQVTTKPAQTGATGAGNGSPGESRVACR